MPRTLLPRTPLQNSGAVASTAPIDPDKDRDILGPASEPASQPTSEPTSQPEPGPQAPLDPNPRVLLVHPPTYIIGPGLLGDAEGPIFARDPLMGAPTLLLTTPLDFPKKVSLYNSIGRLVVFVRRIPSFPPPPAAFMWNGYRKDFTGFTLPTITGSVEFEAPYVQDDFDIAGLVAFAKMFGAPKCVMWNYAHGAQVVPVVTRGKSVKDVEKTLKPHKDFLLERTPSPAVVLAMAGPKSFIEVATEWFDPSTTIAVPPRPKKGVLRRAQSVAVSCREPDYSAVDFNVGATLQRIEVEIDYSIPLPPPK